MAHQPLNIGEYSVYLEETTSTNAALKLLYTSEEVPEGAVVYTKYQTQGRGQQSNVWESEAGENLLMSILLKPHFLFAEDQVWINVMVCLAIRELAEELAISKAYIKWPNDIYVNGYKVAGVLTENVLQGNKIRFSIVGIGLNLNQRKFPSEKARSLAHFSSLWVEPNTARVRLCEKLTKYYALLKAKKNTQLWEKYHKYLLGKGQKVLFKKDGLEFEAEILGIDKKGRLHLMEGDDIKSYAHKEVEFIKILNPGTDD